MTMSERELLAQRQQLYQERQAMRDGTESGIMVCDCGAESHCGKCPCCANAG